MIDALQAQKKYVKHFKTYDRRVTDLCRDRLKPSLNTACHEENYKERIEKELQAFNERFIAVTNIENIDVAFLIANETKTDIGDWQPETTVF